MDHLLARIEKLEYHQKLMLKMLQPEAHEFDYLVIVKNLEEREVEEFFGLCEELNKEIPKQKADKFVFHAPLFVEFIHRLHPKLDPKEVVDACLKQNIYPGLMDVLKRNF